MHGLYSGLGLYESVLYSYCSTAALRAESTMTIQ